MTMGCRRLLALEQARKIPESPQEEKRKASPLPGSKVFGHRRPEKRGERLRRFFGENRRDADEKARKEAHILTDILSSGSVFSST